MVVIRKRELNKLTREQRLQRLEELEKQLMEFKASLAPGGSISNPGKIKAIKRTIARILTKNREEELAELRAARK